MSSVCCIAEIPGSLVSRGEGHLHLTCAYYRPGPRLCGATCEFVWFLSVEMRMISAWLRRWQSYFRGTVVTGLLT